MALLSATEIKRIEKKYAGGISSGVVVGLFQTKGERFSEPSLRKYVQLGLLPKSRRVGTRGRHKGSSGLYPVSVVRTINEIKQALNDGATLEEIRVGRVVLTAEVQGLRRAMQQTVDRIGEALQHQTDKRKRAALRRQLDKHRRAIQKEITGLSRLAARLGQPRTY